MGSIAVVDSGIGGTSVLNEIRKLAPCSDLIYLADHDYGPYGERTLSEVRARTELLAAFLESRGVEVIVIACNSASAAALHHLRSALPNVDFVGMEPALKPAARSTSCGVVAVMATAMTFRGELFRSLAQKYGDGIEVIEQACPGLAGAIESNGSVEALLDEFLAPILSAGADTLVLGCTHYALIKDAIARRLPPHVSIIDPATSVARQSLVVARQAGVELKASGLTSWWSTGTGQRALGDQGWQTIDVAKPAGRQHVAIEGLDVEAELAEVLGLELADLQLEGHEAGEAPVEEHEVDREVLVTDLHRILGSDEAEVATELRDEAAKVPNKDLVEVGLGVPVRKR